MDWELELVAHNSMSPAPAKQVLRNCVIQRLSQRKANWNWSFISTTYERERSGIMKRRLAMGRAFGGSLALLIAYVFIPAFGNRLPAWLVLFSCLPIVGVAVFCAWPGDK